MEPYLALKHAEDSDQPTFYSVTEKKPIAIDDERWIGELSNNNCWATPQGWILVIQTSSNITQPIFYQFLCAWLSLEKPRRAPAGGRKNRHLLRDCAGRVRASPVGEKVHPHPHPAGPRTRDPNWHPYPGLASDPTTDGSNCRSSLKHFGACSEFITVNLGSCSTHNLFNNSVHLIGR
ncbi:hypothetical protein PR202_ga20832 [Eleusine coracana subsp. coracana]|uniref:Uncharacterized protein n=1 Tax=Eleusine coracana subsp. coracana TaxID=191504 RepID=A0AAV5CY53_ELECO|nr:hypothetical protein PR202_ga20832 [Eleusine coracana subsp. coracana]